MYRVTICSKSCASWDHADGLVAQYNNYMLIGVVRMFKECKIQQIELDQSINTSAGHMCRSSIYNYAYSVRNKDKGYYLVRLLTKVKCQTQ